VNCRPHCLIINPRISPCDINVKEIDNFQNQGDKPSSMTSQFAGHYILRDLIVPHEHNHGVHFTTENHVTDKLRRQCSRNVCTVVG